MTSDFDEGYVGRWSSKDMRSNLQTNVYVVVVCSVLDAKEFSII